jgi:hypothetical protein
MAALEASLAAVRSKGEPAADGAKTNGSAKKAPAAAKKKPAAAKKKPATAKK